MRDVAGYQVVKRYRAWIAVAGLIIAIGAVGSVFAAIGIAHSASQKSRQAFHATSNDIASTLQLAIQHEQDLVVSAGGYVAGNPTASEAQFAEWVSSVHALKRYPELSNIGDAAYVSAADLPAFTAKVVATTDGQPVAGGTLQIIPSGNRPYYCLSLGTVIRGATLLPGVHYDICSFSTLGPALLKARNSGQSAYVPLKSGKIRSLTDYTPVYQGGGTPSTVGERQAEFVGWVGTSTLPKVLLDQALQGHPGMAVTFGFHSSSSNVTFASGEAPTGAQSTAISLHNGWTVTTSTVAAGGGVLGDRNALALLLSGIVLSLLLGALVFVLGTGRARAMLLVTERTGELRYQALHDTLTGLPNRALIMDRIEQLLARNRRHGTSGAVLYLDLDDFKDVNDTLGHAAGDRLLVSVSARLESALRGVDTIGRMSGDEFVVLIDGASLEVAPELVAERLFDVMRQPFDLDGVTLPFSVSISVGIAMGDRAEPGDLLRDADVALYQAKAAGKNRAEVFHPQMQTDPHWV
jgi:diguanylate cyclase (GGDEF)-like protein